MEGRMHEHNPLHTRVPLDMLDEGGWVGGGSVFLLVRRITLPFQLWLCL